jgi:hypothetical protein
MEQTVMLTILCNPAIRVFRSLLTICLLLLAPPSPGLAQSGCFDVSSSPPVIAPDSTILTNNSWIWKMRMFDSTIFVPTTGNSCSNGCYFSNLDITITGGTLLSCNFTPPQVPPAGGLVVLDCFVLQNAGATNASLTIQAPCASWTGSFNFPSFVPLSISLQIDPEPTVNLCWNTTTNTFYRAESTADPTSGDWYRLGSDLTGYGTNACVSDPATYSRRFYRVITLP